MDTTRVDGQPEDEDSLARTTRGFAYGVCLSAALWLIAGAAIWLI